jgi:hypothetical protein
VRAGFEAAGLFAGRERLRRMDDLLEAHVGADVHAQL